MTTDDNVIRDNKQTKHCNECKDLQASDRPPPDSLRMSSDVTMDTFSSSNINHSSTANEVVSDQLATSVIVTGWSRQC